jgi:hypothetical protein
MMAILIATGFVSCSHDDDDSGIAVTPQSVSMHFEDTQQLKAEGATTWTSNDKFVATVNQNGLVTGGHVGSTQIIASDGKHSAKCDITITPKYFLYDDPILDWGITPSKVRSSETHEFFSESSTELLMYDYTYGSNICILGYSFKNNKLNSVMVMLPSSQYAAAGLYLLERYMPVTEVDDYFGFVDAYEKSDVKTLVLFGTTSSGNTRYTTIMYGDYKSTSSSSRSTSRKTEIENFVKDIEKAIR